MARRKPLRKPKPLKKLRGEDIMKGEQSCMDVMREVNKISGNILSDPELGQLCKNLQNLS